MREARSMVDGEEIRRIRTARKWVDRGRGALRVRPMSSRHEPARPTPIGKPPSAGATDLQRWRDHQRGPTQCEGSLARSAHAKMHVIKVYRRRYAAKHKLTVISHAAA